MFTQYIPKDALPHVLYAQNEKGVDWYDFSRSLDKTTPKILVTPSGIVACMGTDAEGFPFPVGLNFFQVDELPTGESISWRYLKGKFVAYEKTQDYADAVERRGYVDQMATAKGVIDTLRIEKEYTELSKAKAEKLTQAAKDYIVAKDSLEAFDKAHAS